MLNIFKTHFNNVVAGLHLMLFCTFEQYEKGNKNSNTYLPKYLFTDLKYVPKENLRQVSKKA